MDALQTLFGINRPIILFIYGQMFFILGVAVALQSWHYSRLELARSLKWLAAFGILHGLHEWGDVFIPIQAIYLARPAVRLLYIFELFILAGSFACLFEFGVVLMRPFRRVLWLHGVSAALLLAWIFIVFFLVLPFSPEVAIWYRIANALARYFIGFPAAILTAYGLRQHRIHRIDPLNAPYFSRLFKIAGIAMLIYAFLAGMIPPPIPFSRVIS